MSTFAFLKSALAPYRWRALLGFAFLLATMGLAMSIPWLLKHAVDTIAAGRDLAAVRSYALAIAAAAAVAAATRIMSRFVLFTIGRDVEYDVRNQLFAHIQTQPPAFFQRHGTGDIMSRLTNDLNNIRAVSGFGLLNISNTAVAYVMGLSMMFAIDAYLTMVSLSVFPVLLFIMRRFAAELFTRTRSTQESMSKLSNFIQESLSGIDVIQAFVRENIRAEAFGRESEAYFREQQKLARVAAMMMPFMGIFAGAGNLMVLFFGGRRLLQGHISLGDFVAFIGYLAQLTFPTLALGWILAVWQRGAASIARVHEILSETPEIISPEGAQARPRAGDIIFDHVSFRYPGSDRDALSDVSFTVAAGSCVAISGKTGSGKSALAELIPRLWDVTAGNILVGGDSVSSYNLKTYRSCIGHVPQEAFLFSDTIAANIALGVPGASREAVEQAAETADLAADIAGFPQGLDTIVGERGVTLSGGQRQRAALARALLTNPTILILDDALSAVDTETERRILLRLKETMRGRTTIIISNRPGATMLADEIIVLDNGRVAERGTHADLLAMNGIYADLFRRQELERQLDILENTASGASAGRAQAAAV